MTDRILTAFLRRQRLEAMTLADSSDLLDLMPLGGEPPQHYLARFHCTGLVKTETGEILEANLFTVGFWISDTYLREVDPATVATVLEPRSWFHPNIAPPFICFGHIVPGTPLVDLLYRVFEICTYAKVTMREDMALNREACSWARRNVQRFPLERRPLKRREVDVVAADLEIDLLEEAS